MSTRSTVRIAHFAMAVAVAAAALSAAPARAQDYGAMVRQSMARMNHWIDTRGHSADGIRHARANEAGMQAREHAAWQGLQQAQAQRGLAQQA